jgi:hypothetical protein
MQRAPCPGCGRQKPAFVIDNDTCDECRRDLVRLSAGPPARTWNDIRGQRAIKLQQCDWTQIPDADLTQGEKDAWATYRQALRDLPETYQAPLEVVWPTPPN